MRIKAPLTYYKPVARAMKKRLDRIDYVLYRIVVSNSVSLKNINIMLDELEKLRSMSEEIKNSFLSNR